MAVVVVVTALEVDLAVVGGGGPDPVDRWDVVFSSDDTTAGKRVWV